MSNLFHLSDVIIHALSLQRKCNVFLIYTNRSVNGFNRYSDELGAFTFSVNSSTGISIQFNHS